jgi:hypothetical protein
MQSQIHSDKGRVRTAERAQPLLGQRAPEIQPYGTLAQYPIALDERVRAASVEALNQILADTMMLRDLYKKHHWQVAGHTFYQLHLLFDKHYGEQSARCVPSSFLHRHPEAGGTGGLASSTEPVPVPPRGREVQGRTLLCPYAASVGSGVGHRRARKCGKIPKIPHESVRPHQGLLIESG